MIFVHAGERLTASSSPSVIIRGTPRTSNEIAQQSSHTIGAMSGIVPLAIKILKRKPQCGQFIEERELSTYNQNNPPCMGRHRAKFTTEAFITTLFTKWSAAVRATRPLRKTPKRFYNVATVAKQTFKFNIRHQSIRCSRGHSNPDVISFAGTAFRKTQSRSTVVPLDV